MIAADPSEVLFRLDPGQLVSAHDAVNGLGEAEKARLHMNLAGIDFVSLRLVVHCAELGSLTAAARRDNMSLSSASHRLSNLEDFFRSRFFERDYRGLRLTPAGAVFVGHASVILQALHRMGDQLASMNAPNGTCIAAGHYVCAAAEGLQRYEYRVSRGA